MIQNKALDGVIMTFADPTPEDHIVQPHSFKYQVNVTSHFHILDYTP